MIEVAAPVDFSSIAKAALLHHTTGCRIIHEEVTPNGTITLFPETIIYQQTQSLGTDATIPKRSSYPMHFCCSVPAMFTSVMKKMLSKSQKFFVLRTSSKRTKSLSQAFRTMLSILTFLA